MRLAVRPTIEQAFGAEVRDALGRQPDERVAGVVVGFRKGYLRATFKIAAGAMAYAGPQPRDPAEPFGSAMRQGSRAVPRRWGDFAVEF